MCMCSGGCRHIFCCSLIYSVPLLFLCLSLLHLQCSACVCLWERSWPLSSRWIPVHVFTCSGCLGLLMLFQYTSSLTESFCNASALLFAEACLGWALALLLHVHLMFAVRFVPQELWKSANGERVSAAWVGLVGLKCFASCWRVQLF